MVSSPLNGRIVALTALICLLTPAWAVLPNSREPIELDADSSEFDRDGGTLSFRNVHIRQGTITIAASSARADDLDFQDSLWEFSGNVRIDGEASRIRSDTALLKFRDHQMVRASVEGAPATFERDKTEEHRAISGGANLIEYDFVAGRLTLTGNARIVDGTNEVLGARLLYELESERLIAGSDDSGDNRVRITVTPQTLGLGPEETEAEQQNPEDPPEEPAADTPR